MTGDTDPGWWAALLADEPDPVDLSRGARWVFDDDDDDDDAPAPKTPVTLSPDQERAVEAVLAKLASGSRVVTLAGAAGTGKTTTAGVILDSLGVPYVQAAPTGKAALRLSQVSGRPAVTLHRLAYHGCKETSEGELVFTRRERGSVTGGDLLDGGTTGKDYAKALRAYLSGDCRAVVVVDEASMVGQKILDDLIGPRGCLGPKVQILAIGDHCQLPPVKADPAFDLEGADAKLEQVHRQAGDSPLLALATEIRTQRRPVSAADFRRYGITVERLSTADLGQRIAVEVEDLGRDFVALSSTNRQRIAINLRARTGIGLPPLGEGPAVGERIILHDNNYAAEVANGEIGTVLHREPWAVGEISGWWVVLDLGDRKARVAIPATSWTSTDPKTSGKLPRELREHLRRIVHKGGQAAADAYPIRRRLVGAAPAYCLTVHKSQGSEWPSGAVVLGRASWLEEDEWRLGYTAITRFREGIVPVVGCWS